MTISNPVISKLRSTEGFDSFVNCKGRGYLPITIDKTEVLIYREEVGVSYFFVYPIKNVEDADMVNRFMADAIPYLSKLIEDTRDKQILNNHITSNE